MSTLVIIAHPNMTQSKVNKAWKLALQQRDEVTVHDLYSIYPNEVIDIEAEQQLLEQYETIIFQFPLYWYSYPPLFKQYFDEVLEYGWAYGSTGDKLQGKQFAAVVSVGSAEEDYHAEGAVGYTLAQLLAPLDATSRFVGAKFIGAHALYGTFNVNEAQLNNNIADYFSFINQITQQV
ncbi:NAD(P)H-dependent oxidoreductase [Staphylococcus arlettae]